MAVEFNNEQFVTSADGNGTWRVRLPAMAAGGPYTITVTSTAASSQISDVLFGDVYMYVRYACLLILGRPPNTPACGKLGLGSHAYAYMHIIGEIKTLLAEQKTI